MNDSAKIGFGLLLGFVFLILITYMFFGIFEESPVLKTDNLEVFYNENETRLIVQVNKNPDIAKSELFTFLIKEGLTPEQICQKDVLFVLSEKISPQEVDNFNPEFESCL